MGRPLTLIPEAVFKLCDEMRSLEIAPTVRLLQGRLGGSTASLSIYLRQWREKASVTVPVAEISKELKVALNEWRASVAQAADSDQRIALESCIADNKQLTEELVEKVLVIETLEGSKKGLESKLHETSIENSLLKARIDELKKEEAQLKAEKKQLQEERLVAEMRAERIQGRLDELCRQQVEV